MVRWVVGSVPRDGPIQLFLVPTRIPRLVGFGTVLIEKSSSCTGGSGFPLSLFECFFYHKTRRHLTIKLNVLGASLNKTLPFLNDKPGSTTLIKRKKYIYNMRTFNDI